MRRALSRMGFVGFAFVIACAGSAPLGGEEEVVDPAWLSDDEGKADHASASRRAVFVALEDEGALAVVSAATGRLLKKVDLSLEIPGVGKVHYKPHNVQGDNRGRMVWLTAMPHREGAAGHGEHSAATGGNTSSSGSHAGHGGHDNPGATASNPHDGATGNSSAAPSTTVRLADTLIGVDVATLRVKSRIPLGYALHVAHVIVDGPYAFVTAADADLVVAVDLEIESILGAYRLPAGTKPHGARLTPDGMRLVVAGMGKDGKGSIVVLNLYTARYSTYALPGIGVQSAVTPDGAYAFVSVYDTRQVARLDMTTRRVKLFDLPASSAGPVQIYPSPDGMRLWVADQGILAGRPAGKSLYAIDIATGAVRVTATVSEGPHGVVVSDDGRRAWTTTLKDGRVQSVSTATGALLSSTRVGAGPNGISFVTRGGAMP